MNTHFFVYFNWNNTLEQRFYLSSHDMHELKNDNGLYWTYIYIHWNNVMFITYILMY